MLIGYVSNERYVALPNILFEFRGQDTITTARSTISGEPARILRSAQLYQPAGVMAICASEKRPVAAAANRTFWVFSWLLSPQCEVLPAFFA